MAHPLRSRHLALALILPVFLSGSGLALDGWSPPPAEKQDTVDASLLSRRALVRGPQLEIGEVVKVQRLPGSAPQASARLTRMGQGAEDDGDMVLSVGDRIMKGDRLVTDRGVVLEVLLGRNGRLRLEPESELWISDISLNEGDGEITTRRRLELKKGTLRTRVRQNTITPSPVLVLALSAEIEVGVPDLTVMGGVDVVLDNSSDRGDAMLAVLNGAVSVEERRILRGGDRRVVDSGFGMAIPRRPGDLPGSRPLGKAEIDSMDVVDWFSFWYKVKSQADRPGPSPGKQVWNLLQNHERREIAELLQAEKVDRRNNAFSDPNRQRTFVVKLNRILRDPALFDRDAWDVNTFSEPVERLLRRHLERRLDEEGLILLNRRLLEMAFPGEIEVFGANPEKVALSIKNYKTRYAFSNEEWNRAPLAPLEDEDMELGGP